jgi:hypothetical protein
MSCCPQNAGTLGPRHRMKVRYGGGRPVLIKGPVTGTDYRFSGIERLQLVHPRDAIAIVRNPLFRIEGVVEVDAAEVVFVGKGRGLDA